MKAPTCNLPSNDQDPRVIHDNDATATEHGHCEDEADATENNDGAATEHAEASASPLDLPAEFLIGIKDEDAHDPVDLMLVFQKNLELVQEKGKRIHDLEQQRMQAKGLVSASLLALQHAEPSQLSEPWLHRRPAQFLLLAHVAARDCGCAYPLLVPVPSSSGRRA